MCLLPALSTENNKVGQNSVVIPYEIPRWTVCEVELGLNLLGTFSPSLGCNLTHDVTVSCLD